MSNNKERIYRACGYSDLAHDFARNWRGGYGRTSCHRMSYRYGGQVFSYSTQIAQMTFAKKIAGHVLLITENRHSNTTAKQKRILLSATSHYPSLEVVDNNFNIDENIKQRCKRLDELKKSNLVLKVNRQAYIENFEALEKIHTYFKLVRRLAAFRDVYLKVKNNDVKEFREAENKRRARLKKSLESLMKKCSFSKLCRLAFEAEIMPSGYSVGLRNNLRSYLQKDNDISLVWIYDAETLHTSQRISFPLAQAKKLLLLWANGKLKNGMKIGEWTLIEHTPDYVRVNCHKITTENLTELMKELFPKFSYEGSFKG